MPYVQQIVAEKANIINHNKKIYGTFAEIGAGQEVVSYFFKAGLASQTVAKSMSAYDMVFSDHIYGKADRYVCEERLIQMLEHEYSLLQNRLKKTKGSKSCFFAFANTVTVHSSQYKKENHGWVGLRFQSKPLQKNYDEVLLHVNLKDKTRLQQYEVLGALGVNLIYSAFYTKKQPSLLIQSLVDNFEKNRVEIDVFKCKGPSFKPFNESHVNQELLKQKLSQILVFDPCLQTPLDAFYNRPLLLHFTNKNKILAQKKYSSHSFFTVTQKFKNHQKIILHHCKYLHQLISSIRKYTDQEIILHLDLKDLHLILKDSSYKEISAVQGLGIIFDRKTKIFTPELSKNLIEKLPEWGKILVHKKYIILK